MFASWQDPLALLAVAVAAGYLLLRGLRVLRRSAAVGCAGGCTSCPRGTTGEPARPAPQIVLLEWPESFANGEPK